VCRERRLFAGVSFHVVAVKEALGGWLTFEADDLDAAIELASRIPAACMGGAIEVRPVVEY
jgi:hypothetical protein